MKYLTIKPHQTTVQEVKRMILRELELPISRIVSYEAPETLMGNQKILILRLRKGLEVICKVDGPGFLIDKAFKEFAK